MIDILLLLYEDEKLDIHANGNAEPAPEDLVLTLGRLNEDWLVERSGNSYFLSHSGKILTEKILETLNFIETRIQDQGNDVSISRSNGNFSGYLPARHFFCRNKLLISLILQLPFLSDRHVSIRNPSCSILQDIGLVEFSENCFTLTDTGRDIVAEIRKMMGTIETIENFVDFFETHSWKSVPEFAMQNIGDLIGAELVCDIPLNFNQGFEFYLDILNKAEHIHGVSSWARPHIAETLAERVMDGKEVELIITPELALELFQDPYIEQARELRHFTNLKFRVSKIPVRVGLTVTDKCLSFGLFTKDGAVYDSIYDIVCRSEMSLAWGERLFEYYRKNSMPMRDFFLKSCISSVASKIFLQTG